MGQYHKLINIDKKEYVTGWDIGIFAKHLEQVGYDGSMSDVLYILMIAQGNERRGGGDIDGHDIIGSWVGDRVAVVGDYFDEENVLYTSIVSEYNFPSNGAESVVTVLGGEGIFEDATGEGKNNWNSAGITDPNNSNMGYLKVTSNLNIITE